ncbi:MULTISPECIES: thiamine phosphate synthase [Aerococcus]|uniref:Thiamine-phosphate synthase n=1 Tax=Aerococcus sanguinicola TaxID=119206 RepID=A0A5N1GHA7_9LACT|nr:MULTISPECIES: thiamine phosphate synthase [Aerococcus]KAA9300182.1 thiamine phosphate synthase [Aerococcus sanguinicola]MDK6369524.1 thiamine phosphate synthase [Aerococcus sp. UMB9870]MDK6680011.1 thiamine phosphate synthase [Aerococcus sp. UMB8608]MDK6686107.1 thiamine phosphate synthase [Aerococcus sp. UMB8623]MDK6939887.1 thiamine phosphate synthase [Aerococcus sp. UMB8487]
MSTARQNFDLSAYLVIGPENTPDRSPLEVIRLALEAGFTFIQIRSKILDAKDWIDLTIQAADLIKKMGLQDKVSLVVNDRLDVALAAREAGAKVDGLHVGQTDLPVALCRKYLGPDAIIGLSATALELIDYVQKEDVTAIDYFGAGPLHASTSKPEAGHFNGGQLVTRTYAELERLAQVSPIPVTIGGGVTLEDLPQLAQTGVDSFFVISAVTGADDPGQAAQDLVSCWKAHRKE